MIKTIILVLVLAASTVAQSLNLSQYREVGKQGAITWYVDTLSYKTVRTGPARGNVFFWAGALGLDGVGVFTYNETDCKRRRLRIRETTSTNGIDVQVNKRFSRWMHVSDDVTYTFMTLACGR